MDLPLTATEIALRLAAALIAGAAIGYDRSTQGRVAGLRTNILICLAAAVAMIEANLLLAWATGSEELGTRTDNEEFGSRMDVLRFPLGILSGIGFIGAGAILRRGPLVTGVTTAATLWLTTVIGLVLGAGYFALGLGVTVLALVVLSGFKYLESVSKREHLATLSVEIDDPTFGSDDFRNAVQAAGYAMKNFAIDYEGSRRKIVCDVSWYSRNVQTDAPPMVKELARREGLSAVRWHPINGGQNE